MFPQLEDLPDAGTFDEVNVETLAAAKPDFVFVSSTSDKGNQQVEDIGISTYTLSTAKASVESLRTEFENIGTLLNTSDTAQNLLAFWDDIMSRVDAGAASISESNRLSVYRCGAAITKASHTPWAGNWIRTAGGVSVAEDGTTGDVSVETIAGWTSLSRAIPQRFLQTIACKTSKPSRTSAYIADRRGPWVGTHLHQKSR